MAFNARDGFNGRGWCRMRRIVVTMIAAGALVVLAGAAWACSPQAKVFLSPKSGHPGMGVEVQGRHFNDGEVSLYWSGDKGGDRQHLKDVDAPNGNFDTEITVPASAERGETYYVTGVWTNTTMTQTYEAKDSFWVERETDSGGEPQRGNDGDSSQTLSGGDQSNDDSPDGSQQSNASDGSGTNQGDSGANQDSNDTAADRSGSQDNSTQSQRSGSPSGSTMQGSTSVGSASNEPTANQSTSSEPTGTESVSPEQGDQQASAQPDPSQASASEPADQSNTDRGTQSVGPEQAAEPRPAAPRSVEPQPEPQPAEQQQPAGQSASESGSQEVAPEPALGGDDASAQDSAAEPAPDEADEAVEAADQQRTDDTAPAQAPSPRTSSGDLWSGVAAGDGPSLSGGADGATHPGQSGPGGQLVAGLALLGGGMFLLLAGGSVAALRRQRVRAHVETTRSH